MCRVSAGISWLGKPRTRTGNGANGSTPGWKTSCTVIGSLGSLKLALANSP
jgi:hypothetical protein